MLSCPDRQYRHRKRDTMSEQLTHLESRPVTVEEVREILDLFEIGPEPMLEDVIGVILEWPSACVDGRLNAAMSVRESIGRGPWWAIYLAYVSRDHGDCLDDVTERIGAIRKAARVDWGLGKWVKLSESDLSPELVLDPRNLAEYGLTLDRDQRLTLYVDGSGRPVITVRNSTHFEAIASNAEAPSWYRA